MKLAENVSKSYGMVNEEWAQPIFCCYLFDVIEIESHQSTLMISDKAHSLQ